MQFTFSLKWKRVFSALILGLAGALLSRFCGGTIKFAAVCFVLALAVGFLNVRVSGHFAWMLTPFLCVVFALACVFLTQEVDGIRIPLPAELYALGSLCVLLPVLFLYLIQLLVSRHNVWLPLCLVGGIWILLAIISVWTISTRGTMLIPADVFAARTALGVLNHYELYFSAHMCYSVIGFVLLAFLLSGIAIEPLARFALRRLFVSLSLVLCGLLLWGSMGKLRSNQWLDQGNLTNGFMLNFLLTLKESIPTKPEGYSESSIVSLESKYANEAPIQDGEFPHVIVIMNESFSDLQVLGSFKTDRPVTPFVNSLWENTIHGYAYSSVYGGSTPNSEYEFLTGNTMGFLKASIPFSQLIRQPSYSLAQYLGSLGYTTWATHPMNSRFWNREKVYPMLGLSEFESIEGYYDAPKLRNYTTDAAVYEHVIRELENRAPGEKKFLYAVTVQNHGAYHVPDAFREEVRIVGYDSVDSMVYLSLMRESDAALQTLLEYLEGIDEPVVLLLFGDHQPDATDAFIQFAHGGPLETLEDQMLKYIIPYFVWANYDLEARSEELTSINYLSNTLLEAAGIPLPAYNQALADIRQVIPAINSFGYYSRTEGCFQEIEKAQGAEKVALDQYAMLEYNSVYDDKGRSNLFFPLYN